MDLEGVCLLNTFLLYFCIILKLILIKKKIFMIYVIISFS